MPTCHICGEEKPQEAFDHVTRFSKHKKQPVQWCQDCQTLYLQAREEARVAKVKKAAAARFEVSFL